MGMFLVRLRDRKRDHYETSQSKSHPKGSASAAPPNQVYPLNQEVMLQHRATSKLPLGSPRTDFTQKTSPCRHAPSSPGAPWGTSASSQHCYNMVLKVGHSRTKPEQRYVGWRAPSEPLPAPTHAHTRTHTHRSRSPRTWRALPSQPGAAPGARPAVRGRWPA